MPLSRDTFDFLEPLPSPPTPSSLLQAPSQPCSFQCRGRPTTGYWTSFFFPEATSQLLLRLPLSQNAAPWPCPSSFQTPLQGQHHLFAPCTHQHVFLSLRAALRTFMNWRVCVDSFQTFTSIRPIIINKIYHRTMYDFHDCSPQIASSKNACNTNSHNLGSCNAGLLLSRSKEIQENWLQRFCIYTQLSHTCTFSASKGSKQKKTTNNQKCADLIEE